MYRCILAVAALALGAGNAFAQSASATDLPAQVKNGRIGYVLTHRYWAVHQSPDGKVENWNRGAQRLEGYRAPEIIGAPFSTFFPPEEISRGTPQRLLRDAEHQGTSSYEGWLLRKGRL